MAELIDWQGCADPREAMGRAIAHLQAGQLVGLPTESGYCLGACERLPDDAPPRIALRGPEDLAAWSPHLGPLVRRLVKRSWPGPLIVNAPIADAALRFAADLRQRVCPGERALLCAPDEESVQTIVRQLEQPLLLASAGWSSASELLANAAEGVALAVDDGPRAAAVPTILRGDGLDWSIEREGTPTAEDLRRRLVCLVVFVCTGNTCRSPLAEALFKRRLAAALQCEVGELPARGFLVLSAGIAAMMGGGAAAEAIETARSFGGDLSEHRSRPLSLDLAAQADFLIAMTGDHRDAMAHYYPALGAEPRLLHPQGADIADPVGQAPEVYRACAEQIDRSLEALTEEVMAAGPQGAGRGPTGEASA